MSKNKNVKNEMDIDLEQVPIRERTKKNKLKLQDILKIVFILFVVNSVFAYLGYKIYDAKNVVENVYTIINCSLLIGLTLLFGLTILFNKKAKNIFGILASVMLIIVVGFNFLVEFNFIKLQKQDTIPNFKDETINDALVWASNNNINIEQILEFSDNVDDGFIITQDILPNTLLKNVEKIKLSVSSGPDPNKEIEIPNFVGLSIDDLLEFIKTHKLSNVKIDFEEKNDIDKDEIISQSHRGEIKRNAEIKFVASLGSRALLDITKVEKLEELSEFDALIWLKRNGFNYKIEYDFSATIKKGFVIKQSVKSGDKANPNADTITITISKGKKIVVPDLLSMSVEDIVKWIAENDLKIKYDESYSSTIAADKVMKASVEKGSEITAGTTVTITISTGQLKFPSFSSLQEFRTWASNFNVKFTEKREFNDSVAAGNIIDFSIKTGSNVIFEDTITVRISQGKAVTVPNLVGMSRSAITDRCNSLGLNCTFQNGSFSNIPANQATAQSVGAGNQVVSGTTVTITLSRGPAKQVQVVILPDLFGLTAEATINSLRNDLNQQLKDKNATGITFNFTTRASNDCPMGNGFVHQESPIQGGGNWVTEGQTYQIIVIKC